MEFHVATPQVRQALERRWKISLTADDDMLVTFSPTLSINRRRTGRCSALHRRDEKSVDNGG